MQELLVQVRLKEAKVCVRLHERLNPLLRCVENVLVGAVEGLGNLGASAGVQVELRRKK